MPLHPDNQRHCPECGAPLSHTTLGGLCPRCVTRRAFEAEGNKELFPESLGRIRYFGDYELVEEIARGGMGIVYRAWQRSLGREVAVKLLREGALATLQDIDRFRKEANAAASLSHPNIVAVHEVGEHEGQPFFSMDFVAGMDLAERARPGPLAAREAALLTAKLAQAIQHAHQRGVLHRDLKPSNVIVDHAGEPHLTDFGLAQRADQFGSLTLTGQVLGTPSYMAPEQAAARRGEIGCGADIYSLGALLYHLLTGRAPFTGDTPAAVLRQVEDKEPVPPRLLNPSVPPDLETICLKCLAKEIGRRYPTAQTLAEDLERFLQDKPIQARAVSPGERVWRWCRRNPLAAFWIVLSVLCLLALALGSFAAAQRIGRSRDAETMARATAEERRRQAQRNRYAADMLNAQQAWTEGNLRHLRALLDANRPAQGEEDMRGFEWHYFFQLAGGDQTKRLLLGHQPWFDGAMSPDGRFLCYQTFGAIDVFDTVQQSEVAHRTLELGTFPAARRHIAATRDGAWFAVADMWGLHLGHREDKTLRSISRESCEALAFSPDGKQLVVAMHGTTKTPNRRLALWDVASARELRSLGPDTLDLNWAPDGRGIQALQEQRKLREIDAETGKTVRELQLPDQGVPRLARFSPDGRWLLRIPFDGDPEVLRTDTGERVTLLTGIAGNHANAVFSPDGQLLAVAGEEQLVRLWETKTWREPAPLRGHEGTVFGLGFAADSGLLVSGGADLTVRWWASSGARHGEKRTDFAPNTADLQVFRPVFWGASQVVLASNIVADAGPSTSIIWDFVSGRNVASLPGLPVGAAQERPRLLLLQDWRRFVLWDAATQTVEAPVPVRAVPAKRVPRLSPDGRFVAVWNSDEEADVFRADSGTLLVRISPACTDIAFSPSGRFLATTANGQLWFYDVETRQRFDPAFTERCSCVTWLPDGKTVAAATGNNITLVSGVSGTAQNRLTGHRAEVISLALSPDGRTLASGSEDRTIRLWNCATWREVARIQTPQTPYFLSFAPDGAALLHGGSYGYVALAASRDGTAAPPVTPPSAPATNMSWAIAASMESSWRLRERADRAACASNLMLIFQAIRSFQNDRGRWPDGYQELNPYLTNWLVRICPVQLRQGRVVGFGEWATPSAPSSYIYHFCTNVIHEPPPEGMNRAEFTGRELYIYWTNRLGHKVPLLRCLAHKPTLNLCFDGELRDFPLVWQQAFTKSLTNTPGKP